MIFSDSNNKANYKLHEEVISRDLCTLCGSCVGLCPYCKIYKEEVRIIDTCDLEAGRCYAFCPRTSLDLDAINRASLDVPYKVTEIGDYKEIIIARATDPKIRAKAQHGGAVSTFVCLALETGDIEAAVLTSSADLEPSGKVAINREDVLSCCGSNFLASPALETFNKLAKTDVQKIGFVGTPCQIIALAKRKICQVNGDNNINKLRLTIGLFCNWTLSHSFLSRLSQVAPIPEIKKMDVPSKSANIFQVYTAEGLETLPLEEVTEYVRPGCNLCLDMTSELADISIGVARGMPEWNTVIIRTETGKRLVEDAKEAGLIEAGSLHEESLNNLKKASLKRKKTVLQAIVSKTGTKDDLIYLKLKPDVIDLLLT